VPASTQWRDATGRTRNQVFAWRKAAREGKIAERPGSGLFDCSTARLRRRSALVTDGSHVRTCRHRGVIDLTGMETVLCRSKISDRIDLSHSLFVGRVTVKSKRMETFF
jgi:hypothetical protein